MVTNVAPPPVGDLLRRWRERRRVSQLDLSGEAGISARHLSFIETGRAKPSRETVLRLAKHLEVPLREQNDLLLAAGYAPVFPQRPLDDPALQSVRETVGLVLRGHEPFPALALDRHWDVVAMNRAVPPLLDGVSSALLEPPVNVLRLSLHPDGLEPRILNLARWREHLFEQLARQIRLTSDPALIALKDELGAYPGPPLAQQLQDHAGVAVPLQLVAHGTALSLISTTTVFGTPVDVTVSELALETFFPADAETAEVLKNALGRQTRAPECRDQ